VNVAGLPTSVTLSPAELERIYFPMLSLLDEQSRRERIVAGLAGIPGAGKSTFAAMVSYVAQVVLGPNQLAVIGIDGWHYPNTQLDRRRIRDVAGRTTLMRQRKGAPETFDTRALRSVLRQLRQADHNVSVPVYDRRRHEPTQDALTIPSVVRIVVVEGNYVLGGRPEWDAVAALLSPRFFLACNPAVARRRVIDRHMAGGCSLQEAEHKYETNDRFNTKVIRSTADRASYIIDMDRLTFT